MMTYMILSLIASTIAIAAYGYIYWNCGKLATLSVVMITLIELGYLFIGKYSYYFVPLEMAVLLWNIIVVLQCGKRNIQIAMLLSAAIVLLSRVFLESYHFLGLSSLMYLPITFYWYYNCCKPHQDKREERLWGERKYEIA